MTVEPLAFDELCRWILEGEAAIHALPFHSKERAVRIHLVKGLRDRLHLYPEYRLQVRAWCSQK